MIWAYFTCVDMLNLQNSETGDHYPGWFRHGNLCGWMGTLKLGCEHAFENAANVKNSTIHLIDECSPKFWQWLPCSYFFPLGLPNFFKSWTARVTFVVVVRPRRNPQQGKNRLDFVGISIAWGYPKWMVYNRNPTKKRDDLDVPLWLRKPPCDSFCIRVALKTVAISCADCAGRPAS